MVYDVHGSRGEWATVLQRIRKIDQPSECMRNNDTGQNMKNSLMKKRVREMIVMVMVSREKKKKGNFRVKNICEY